MLFPDCRNDCDYNQDFLTGIDKESVFGYDFAVDTIDNFFDNPEFINDDKIMRFFAKQLPVDMKSEYEVNLISPNAHKEMRKVTTYGDYIRMRMLSWLEMQRNEMITAFVDKMPDDLYEAIRNKIMRENKDKEFYDTRKFMTTGEK